MVKIILIIHGVYLWLVALPILANGSDSTPPVTQAQISAPKAAQKPSSANYEAGLTAYDAGDYGKARHIWKPLAETGDVSAQRGMGKMYSKGQGVDRDFTAAHKWYRPAAEKGDAESQYRLAVGYAYGLGVKKDEAAAVTWLRKAATNGQKRAQKSLAKAYEDGLFGLPRDPAQAKYWYNKANSGS